MFDNSRRRKEDLIKVTIGCAWHEKSARKESHNGAQDCTIRPRNKLLGSEDPKKRRSRSPRRLQSIRRSSHKTRGSVAAEPLVKIGDEDRRRVKQLGRRRGVLEVELSCETPFRIDAPAASCDNISG